MLKPAPVVAVQQSALSAWSCVFHADRQAVGWMRRDGEAVMQPICATCLQAARACAGRHADLYQDVIRDLFPGARPEADGLPGAFRVPSVCSADGQPRPAG